MKPVTISSKYQFVIPHNNQKLFNLKPGQKILFIPYHGSLRVAVIPSISQARGMLKGMNTEEE